MDFKIPVSVLVIIHTPALDVLLIERARTPGAWQSVTGSLEHEQETPRDAAVREVFEETAIDALAPDCVLQDWHQTASYPIHPTLRHRYAPEVLTNLEHVFSLRIPAKRVVRLAPDEHIGQQWLPQAAAAAKVFSATNRDAILRLK